MSDPTLDALQNLYGYASQSQDPNLKNLAGFHADNLARDASDQLDQQIKSLEDALKALEDTPDGKSSQQYRQLKAQLDDLQSKKDTIGKASDSAFWKYRPAGWTGEPA